MFERYAADRRTLAIPGYTVHASPDLTHQHPKPPETEALFAFARFAPGTADSRIDEELRQLRLRGWEAEWKVHDFDEPADLKARLEARGLRAHHEEALMVLDLETAAVPDAIDAGPVIERAQGDALDAMAAFQERIWDISLPWLPATLREMAHPQTGTALIFFARDGEQVVASGWIDFMPGSAFAQLCGGAVLEAYRGRGIYSRLFARRVAEARRRGVRFVAVDAAPMSRPILEKKGFRFVCRTYPMRTRPYDTSAVTRG